MSAPGLDGRVQVRTGHSRVAPFIDDEEPPRTAQRGPLSTEEPARIDAYWRAANYVSVGPDLPAGQPAAARAAAPGARQAAPAWALGHHLRAKLRLRHINRVIKRDDLKISM